MKNLLVSILTCSFIIAQTPGRVNKQIDRIADKIEKKLLNGVEIFIKTQNYQTVNSKQLLK